MVRQCITVSVFILVINCLLSTWPCLSLFHSSLELSSFCVTWVDCRGRWPRLTVGQQLCPASTAEHTGRALVQWQQPCLLLQERWLSPAQPSSHCQLRTTSCYQAAATSATFCQSPWRTVAYSLSQATTNCPTASSAITGKNPGPITCPCKGSPVNERQVFMQ